MVLAQIGDRWLRLWRKGKVSARGVWVERARAEMELRFAKMKKVCLPFLFFFSLLCVSFSEFLVAILDKNSFLYIYIYIYIIIYIVLNFFFLKWNIYIYIYISGGGGIWSGSQKRMITRSSHEMCKPYCVIYHCYLSSFPLNFLSFYKSLYTYIHIYIYIYIDFWC